MDPTGWNRIKPSKSSMRITNPIRDIVDKLVLPSPPPKDLIALSIGDPTVFGNLNVPSNIDEALVANVRSHKFNGYAHSCGYAATRKAIAGKYATPERPLTENDVIVTSGASGALEIVFGALLEEGQNLLIPAPGFSLYGTLCAFRNVEARQYHLNPNMSWEIDLVHLESLIDAKTAAILVNNPSNPCGSVYSREHCQAIVALAEKHQLPIIADEIYSEIVFEGYKFTALSDVSANVPILSVGGIAKLFVVPGWRLGWIVIYDCHGLFADVRVALTKMTQLVLGANTLVQSVIDECLNHTNESYFKFLTSTLHENAKVLCDRLVKVDGLTVVEPHGAMYMMVGVKPEYFADIKDDVEFAKKLLNEEMVFTLPATIFNFPNYVRLVICAPKAKLAEACDRIAAFCAKHKKL